MIIIEGPDGAGKTTLIRRVMDDFPQLHLASKVVDSDTKALVNLRRWTDDNLTEGFQPTLFDRHRLISEPIYSSVMHKQPDRDFWDAEWLIPSIQYLRATIKPVMIFCLPPWGEVWKNTSNDPNNKVIFPHILKIYNAYVAAYANWDGARRWNYCHSDHEEHYGAIHQRITFALKNRTEFRDRH